MSVGRFITEIRRKHRLTRPDLALLLGISKEHVRVMNMDRAPISSRMRAEIERTVRNGLPTLDALKRAFDVAVQREQGHRVCCAEACVPDWLVLAVAKRIRESTR